MKLIFCPICHDILKLALNTVKACECGESWGAYEEDGLNAFYGGEAVPLGIANRSFFNAVNKQPPIGLGKTFEAFVIPAKCNTFKKESQ